MRIRKKYDVKIWILLLGFYVLFFAQTGMGTVQAAKISLNKTKVTMTEGNIYTLKLTNTKKRPKWSSNNKKVATVTAKGKVIAKKMGTAVITARLGGNRHKCTVIVKKPSVVSSKQEKDVVTLVNKERAKRGLPELELDEKLQRAAQKRATEIAKNFSHERPDGTLCFTVLDEYNVHYTYTGENIAAGQSTAKRVVKAWMGSVGHKANMLNPGYGRIGVGYYKSTRDPYQYYWVQIFTD